MAELDDENLKVIRLDNGEILFSKVLVTDKSKDNGYLELHWPMKVLMKFDDEQKSTQLALLKWLPFTDTTSVPLAARCIMSVSDLGEEYKNFYLNSVREDTTNTQDQELNKMSKILAEFEPGEFMN
jgi:type II restriction/modification system DNA methylase subunit YeeA|tara:strand:- start:80 stop:457 length:378 start_codon:yes stop_codon:yes gene_type:complete